MWRGVAHERWAWPAEETHECDAVIYLPYQTTKPQRDEGTHCPRLASWRADPDHPSTPRVQDKGPNIRQADSKHFGVSSITAGYEHGQCDSVPHPDRVPPITSQASFSGTNGTTVISQSSVTFTPGFLIVNTLATPLFVTSAACPILNSNSRS